MLAIRRLKFQYNHLITNPNNKFAVRPVNDHDLFHWIATLIGPENSGYTGGIFFIDILFSDDYPFKPPKCRFKTKIYHPNIDANGYMSLDIFDSYGWSPALTIEKVLENILALLTDINPDDALVPEIAMMYKTNRQQYDTNVRQWTDKYAK